MSTVQPELPTFSRDAGELPPLAGTEDTTAVGLQPLSVAGSSVLEEPPGEDTTVLTRPSSVPTVAIPSAVPAVEPGQGTLLAMPVSGRKTSRFGMRFHPIRKVWKLHSGLDLAAPCGTPVGAAAPGTVTRTGWAGGNGIQVKIDHGTLGGRHVVTTYNHLSAIGVRVGQSVQTHQGVGRVGNTGFSTGCHLHFEVIANGKFTDPEPWLNGTAGAVDFADMNSERPAEAGPAVVSSTPPSSPPVVASSNPPPTPSVATAPSPRWFRRRAPVRRRVPSPRPAPPSRPRRRSVPRPALRRA